jgi:hypothetical protein
LFSQGKSESRYVVAEVLMTGISVIMSNMATVGSVTRQIAALEIGSKKPAGSSSSSSTRPGHTKQPSNTNVAKLLTKFSAPNPFPNAAKPTASSSLRNLASGPSSTKPQQPAAPKKPAGQPTGQPAIDIGNYDGGLETENDKRGEKVYGEAAEELALDSSVNG